MSKVKPTMFDTGNRDILPAVDPEKRVGGGEYKVPTPNNVELIEQSGIGYTEINVIDPVVIKPAPSPGGGSSGAPAPLTEPNVPPPIQHVPPPTPYQERHDNKEENPLLNSINPNDIKDIMIDGDEVGFKSDAAMRKVAEGMGISGDISSLDEKETNELVSLASEFAKVAGYVNLSMMFGSMGRMRNNKLEYNKAGKNATGILGLMNSVSGETDFWGFTDVGEQAAFLHALTNKAIEWHLPEYIDKYTGMIHNSELKQLSLEYNIVFAAQQSNLEAFKKLYGHLESARRVRLKDNLLRTLISYYRNSEGSGDIHALLECMAMVDSKWNVDPDDGKTLYVYYYSFASNDAYSGLVDTEHWKAARVGRQVRAKTAAEVINSTVPSYRFYN